MTHTIEVTKLMFPFLDTRVGIVEIPVEVRLVGADSVVVLTRVEKGAFRLERALATVMLALLKHEIFRTRDVRRSHWVLFMPECRNETRDGAAFLVQPGETGSGVLDAFPLGALPAANVIPLPRRGTAAQVTFLVEYAAVRRARIRIVAPQLRGLGTSIAPLLT